MFEPAQIFAIARGVGIATIVSGALMTLAFIFKWGFRFRLVGVTGFLGVLTSGLFALNLGLYIRPSIPNTVHYSRVFDTGAAQVVIAIAPTVTEEQLDATMHQAAVDLFSRGRLAQQGEQLTIRVRTIVHPEPGVSKPLYLGEVKRSFLDREDPNATYTLYRDQFAQLPRPTA